MSGKPAEVVVIGGGAIGLCVAWSLRRRGASVTLLERARCGSGSTGRATGGVRTQFGSEVNVRLSLASLGWFRDWEEVHGGDIGYRPIGYLFLATTRQQVEALARGDELQRACGARVELLRVQEVPKLVPALSPDGVLGASFGPDDGLADPGAAVSSLVSSCARAGVRILEETEVQSLTVRSGAVVGVRTNRGDHGCDVLVLAAGVWSPGLLGSLGVDLPITPRHRQVYRATPFAGVGDDCPFVVDQGTGVYFHPDPGGTVFGGGDRDGTVGLDDRFRPDEAPRIIEMLTRRVPAAAEASVVGGWAGVRDMSPDDHAVVGAVDEVAGLYLAAGFSGHGFMHSPAVGEEVARLALAEPATIDLRALSPTRFAGGRVEESYAF